MKPSIISVSARLGAVLALLAGAYGSTKAQTAPTQPAPSSGSSPSQETIVLSPFEVSAEEDTGYRATNTLDGSRLNTALRDTPGAISIYTRDLLDDLGITDISEMLRYDVNTEESVGDDAFGGPGGEQGKMGDVGLSANWRTRGLQASSSTDGFNTTGKTDMYNVETVGSNRGPNAILFGSGAAGGVMNLRTKSANPARNTNEIELRVGDDSTRRASVDVNRALIKNKLAVRLMGLAETRGNPMPHMYTDKESATIAGRYRFKPETSLSMSFEKTRTEGVRGRPWHPSDSLTGFLRQLEAGQVVWDPAQERYETLSGAVVGAAQGAGNVSNRNVLVQGPELGTPVLWEGATSTANRVTLATTTSQFNGTKPAIDEAFAPFGAITLAGEGEFGVVHFSNFTATLNHRWFENFYMELAFNKSVRDSDTGVNQGPDIRADLNYRLPDGSINPYFFGNGYYFMQQGYIRQTQGYDNETLRAAFSYQVGSPNKWWGEHRFAVMGERHVADNMSYRTRHVWLDAPFGGTPESAANQIFRRRYFRIDGPNHTWTAGYNPEGIFTTEEFTSATLGGRTLTSGWIANNNLNYDDNIVTDSQLFVMQNYLFNKRLVTTVGVRRDQIDSSSPNTVRDAVTQEWRYATPADQPRFDATNGSWIETTEEKGGRKSIGAVYHATKNFSLTANASNGVGINRRNRTVLPEQKVPDSSRGRGEDYGIAFSFLDNRISGSIKRYKSESIQEGGQGIVEPVFVFPNNDVMASFDYYLREAGLTTFGPNDPIGSIDDLRTTLWSGANGYLSDRVSRGYEFELIANPTRNWALRASYSYTDRTRTGVLTEGEGWWAERVELWKNLDALYVQRTGRPSIYNQLVFSRTDAFTNQTVAERIADSDRELADTRFREEQGYGNRKHKANIWSRYLISQGPLKGLTFGGGWRFQSKNISGINLATREIYHGNAKSVFDAMVAYRTRGLVGWNKEKLAVTYQLNVVNLLDDRTIFISKTQTDTITGQPYTVRAMREDPRYSSLSMRVAF